MGLSALRTSLEIKYPNVSAKMQNIFFMLALIVMLATADVKIGSFQTDPLAISRIVLRFGHLRGKRQQHLQILLLNIAEMSAKLRQLPRFFR
jgi:hypothetical protein